MKIAMPELLAPAGNMERLTTAIDYGADAVYLGAQSMSLRNYADNFTPEQLRRAANTPTGGTPRYTWPAMHSRGTRTLRICRNC